MAAATIVSPEEYLRTSYDPDVEYVDGQLVERNVGEWRHGRLQGLIFALFLSRELKRFAAFTEVRMRVASNPARYRIPDVSVVELPYPPEPVLTRPPHLAIEIVSPDDRVPDILQKVAEYLKAGVPYVWVADPYRRTLHVADNIDYRQVDTLNAETPLVGSVDFGALFAQLDELEN
ncbi:MAG: Uma2 family endonuclease [Bryobacteraceae bacterium]